jgi:hypothetical protein
MTHVDEFASRAMAAIMGSREYRAGKIPARTLAETSYSIADAMQQVRRDRRDRRQEIRGWNELYKRAKGIESEEELSEYLEGKLEELRREVSNMDLDADEKERQWLEQKRLLYKKERQWLEQKNNARNA